MTTVEQRIEELKAHPIFCRWQAWAIEAKATCDVQGHDVVVDRHCRRCSAEVEDKARSYGAADAVIESDEYHCAHWTVDQGCPLHGDVCY